MDELWDGIRSISIMVFQAINHVLIELLTNVAIKAFGASQEKMVSMLTYYLMDEGMVPYFDFLHQLIFT